MLFGLQFIVSDLVRSKVTWILQIPGSCIYLGLVLVWGFSTGGEDVPDSGMFGGHLRGRLAW